MTSKRLVKPFRAGSGIVVVIPKDWVDGMGKAMSERWRDTTKALTIRVRKVKP